MSLGHDDSDALSMMYTQSFALAFHDSLPAIVHPPAMTMAMMNYEEGREKVPMLVPRIGKSHETVKPGNDPLPH